MRVLAALIPVLLVLTPQLRAADKLADKTPAHFAQSYGEPIELLQKTECSFYLPDALPRKINVSGHFLVLKYVSEALTIEVVYLQPENTLAAVNYTRPRVWTSAQTQAIIMAYGDTWARVKTKGSTLAYTTTENTLALTGINTLAIQTHAATMTAQRAQAAGEVPSVDP